MPPKKREKDSDTSKNSRMDQMQADHELFLQAFEKPTQIYRFLRTRNMISPVFLNRTLSYMRQRMSRSHKPRKDFSVDCLMERIVKKNMESMQLESVGGYMTLTFLGFYDKKVESHHDPVKVETFLLNICHKKRKDVSSPIMQKSLGTSEVPINPSEDQPPPKASTISISTESFSLSNGHLVKSYMLLLRVTCNSHGMHNSSDMELSEPAQKRRKSSGPLRGTQMEEVKLYGSELVVYDKHKRCLLTDGDYELVLQEVQPSTKNSPKKHSSWEAIGEIQEDCGPFEVFSKGPTLKFRLNWTTEPSVGLVDRPKPIRPLDQCLDSNSNKENHPDSCNTSLVKTQNSEPPLQIVYQFLYNNNSRQQTEACEDLTCPWCSLDCVVLYALLKHLKLCHSRFTFTYVPIPQGARIDVAINECYDGSYTGSPHDLISQPPGFAFSRNGPVRRTSVSNILVCRPKRPKPSLSEFLELDENEYDGQRPYITGHNRLYHHTTTCLPIYPKEMDVDSEGEHDPKWLQTKTMMMIDDFTDVNEGEKELMKMWNLHVMKYGYVGDCQIPLACSMFLASKGKELLQKNLYRNFVLHMCSLFDFSLISPVTLYTTIQRLQDLISENSDVRSVLQDSWQAQRKNWVASEHVDKCERRKSPPKSVQHNSNFNSQTSDNSSTTRRKSVSSAEMNQHETNGVPRRKSPPAAIGASTNGKMQPSTGGGSSPQQGTEGGGAPRRKSPPASTKPMQGEGTELSRRKQEPVSQSRRLPPPPPLQRRKSTTNLSPSPVAESMQQRRKSLGQQHTNGYLEPLPPPPPLRRKSFNTQITSESTSVSIKNNVLTSHNGQSTVSVLVETSSIQHRRKSSSQQVDSSQGQNHTCKSSGS